MHRYDSSKPGSEAVLKGSEKTGGVHKGTDELLMGVEVVDLK